MPFIAVAIMVSLFLGGTAAAAQSSVGHAAIEHMGSVWSNVEASIGGNADTANSNDTKLTGHESGQLRIRSDADAEAQAVDQAQNDSSALHAEGQSHVEVNVF